MIFQLVLVNRRGQHARQTVVEHVHRLSRKCLHNFVLDDNNAATFAHLGIDSQRADDVQ